MLDGLDLILRWFLEDVRTRFPDSKALFCDEEEVGCTGAPSATVSAIFWRSRGDRRTSASLLTACATRARPTTTSEASTLLLSSRCSGTGR